MDRRSRYLVGIGLALLAAALMLMTDGPIAAPITMLIVAIALIATSRGGS